MYAVFIYITQMMVGKQYEKLRLLEELNTCTLLEELNTCICVK